MIHLEDLWCVRDAAYWECSPQILGLQLLNFWWKASTCNEVTPPKYKRTKTNTNLQKSNLQLTNPPASLRHCLRRGTGHPAIVVGAKEHLGALHISVNVEFRRFGEEKMCKNMGPKSQNTQHWSSRSPLKHQQINSPSFSGAILWDMSTAYYPSHVHGKGTNHSGDEPQCFVSLEHWCHFWETLRNDHDQYLTYTYNHLKNGSPNQQKIAKMMEIIAIKIIAMIEMKTVLSKPSDIFDIFRGLLFFSDLAERVCFCMLLDASKMTNNSWLMPYSNLPTTSTANSSRISGRPSSFSWKDESLHHVLPKKCRILRKKLRTHWRYQEKLIVQKTSRIHSRVFLMFLKHVVLFRSWYHTVQRSCFLDGGVQLFFKKHWESLQQVQLPLHLHPDKHQKCNLTRSLGSYVYLVAVALFLQNLSSHRSLK